MAKRFEGKVAIATGDSSGIGRVTVRAFAYEGAKRKKPDRALLILAWIRSSAMIHQRLV
jgi:NAD(P)-dependent dehydrogenase (short-subunit alcohol dehydrogenase family)